MFQWGCNWTSLPLAPGPSRPHAPRGIAMAVPRNPNAALESLDAVFSDLSSKWAGYGLQPRYNAVEFTAETGSGGAARRAASYKGPEPPPALEDPANTKAAYDWFQSERARLEEYTRYQFAAIPQQQ